jgi:hypothetical protein
MVYFLCYFYFKDFFFFFNMSTQENRKKRFEICDFHFIRRDLQLIELSLRGYFKNTWSDNFLHFCVNLDAIRGEIDMAFKISIKF